jgi:Holliday junction resolvase RusA-like endonuclease
VKARQPAGTLLFELTLEGNPIPKMRPRVNTYTRRVFPTKRVSDAEDRWKWIAIAARLRPYEWPVRIELECYRRTAHQVDYDNLAKLVTDALNKIAWEDDSQIVKALITVQLDRAAPRSVLRAYAV